MGGDSNYNIIRAAKSNKNKSVHTPITEYHQLDVEQ